MKTLYRIALGLALINGIAAAVVGLVYYFWARPEWADSELWRGVEVTLRDPNTSVETVRKIALDAYVLIANSLAMNDIAIDMILFACAGATICLAYIGVSLRAKVKQHAALQPRAPR